MGASAAGEAAGGGERGASMGDAHETDLDLIWTFVSWFFASDTVRQHIQYMYVLYELVYIYSCVYVLYE